VPTGGAAIFNNAPDVVNIFSRVTGGSISSIDGLIQANGSANLFLINPAGIIFGSNASLNIGGSFIGSTAQSFKFSDGTEFSTVNPAPPLLTINVPIGLQMGPEPGAITVQNTGHRMQFIQDANLQPANAPIGLSIALGQTLALIGGAVNLDGGILRAPSGHLELGSAQGSIVGINTTTAQWKFDYSHIQQFGNIQLLHQSLVETSGAPAGSMNFQGRNIEVKDGSGALLVNQGSHNSGHLTLHASQSLEMKNPGTYGFDHSFLWADNNSTGLGGNLLISAPHILLQDGAIIGARNFKIGKTGNIVVDAASTLEFTGYSPTPVSSGLNNFNFGSGLGGDIQVNTGSLKLSNAGVILNSARGVGNGGNVIVNAAQQIEIVGQPLINLNPSGIIVSTFRQGNTGQLTISTPKLTLLEGGAVITSTLGRGNGGNAIVNVSQEILVSGVGKGTGTGNPSRIGAKAELVPLPLQRRYELSPFPQGNSGDLVINTPKLTITDRGNVGTSHEGVGNAGDLYINSDRILLDSAGSITANTLSGEGGNLKLQATMIILRHSSNITATAGGSGNGGNITINAPIIAGFENSDIIANAVKGRGGNIQITTQGIFGLKFRPQLTPENDITASSQFGLNGTVAINNVTVDPTSGLVELPVVLADASRKMGSVCDRTEGSSFVYTGRGGLPENPLGRLETLQPWEDLRDLSAFQDQPPVAPLPRHRAEPTFIVEANAIRRNPDGTMELVAIGTESVPMDYAVTCAGRFWFGQTQE
jgi:filamentous hemagglutinin family protein